MVNVYSLKKYDVWLSLLFYLFVQFIQKCYGILPEASQEGMLRPFKSYADVTLFHYNVPPEVRRATWEFAAFMDHPSCPIKEAHIFIQHGSYPVMSVENASFPDDVYTGRTFLFHLRVNSSYQPHDATVFPVEDPLPGNWFAAAYLSKWDRQVKQEGLGMRCHYSLGSVALWTQVTSITLLRPGSAPMHYKAVESLNYFKVFVPSGTWSFQVKISNCSVAFHNTSDDTSSSPCIQGMALRPRALPHFLLNSAKMEQLFEGREHTFSKLQPYAEGYYYLLIAAQSDVSFSIEVVTKECGVTYVGHGIASQMTMTAAAVTELVSGTVSRIRHSNQTVRSDWAGVVLQSGDGIRSLSRRERTDDECLPIFQLARITHAQDFSDTFLLQGPDWYTTWIALNDVLPIFVQFDIEPFLDIGGSLSISIHLDEVFVNSTDQLLTVNACIRKGRAPHYQNGTLRCPSELRMSVSSIDTDTLDATKLLPYPEPDTWFIAFQVQCVYNGSVTPCSVDDVMVSLDIRTQPCLFSGQPCGKHGVCQEVHKGLHFFTSCNCMAGYRGWGCNDGSEAEHPPQMFLSLALLMGSNLFFVPSILLAVKRNLLTHATVYGAIMTFSTVYHACDQNAYYCISRYEVLQFCDFFCSILAIWVTLVALAGLPPDIVSALHMAGAILIAMGVQYNRTGIFIIIIPAIIGLVILGCVWALRSWRKGACVRLSWCSLTLVLPAMFFVGTGIVLFAVIETEHNYQYVHSAWHAVMGLALLFLLPKPETQPVRTNVLGNDSAELFGSTDIDALTPVFFVTSDMDSLIVPQS